MHKEPAAIWIINHNLRYVAHSVASNSSLLMSIARGDRADNLAVPGSGTPERTAHAPSA